MSRPARAAAPVAVLADAAEVAERCAGLVAEVIAARERTRLALAGGTTPLRAYERLAALRLPWGRVSVLFGDERCLPAEDPETNYNLAREALLARVRPATVHRIPGELGPDEAARLYEPVVAAAPLDLVLLGVGEDGHTASLFPGNPALRAEGLVAAVRGAAKPPPERVTLTLRALREARRVVIVATGASKAAAVRRAFAGEVPAGMIADAEWLLDREAAAEVR